MQEQFAFESRWDAKSHSYHGQVGCTCRKCHRTEWTNASGPGWGRRLFKEKGWLLGPNANRHVCPTCRLQRPEPARPLTPSQKRAAYLKIERAAGALPPLQSKRELQTKVSDVAMLVADPSLLEPTKMAEALSALGTVTVAAPKNPPPTLKVPPFQAPDVVASRSNNIRDGVIASRGFSLNPSAYSAAKAWFKRNHNIAAVAGYHYKVEADGPGLWRWTVLPFDPDAHGPMPKRNSHYKGVPTRISGQTKTGGFSSEFAADRAARRFLNRLGIQAVRNIHYVVTHDPAKHCWTWRVRTDAEIALGTDHALSNVKMAPLTAPEPITTAPEPYPRSSQYKGEHWKDYLRRMGHPKPPFRQSGYQTSWSAARAAWNCLRSDELPEPVKGRDFETFRNTDKTWSWRSDAPRPMPALAEPEPVDESAYTPRELHWVKRAKNNKRHLQVETHGFATSGNAKRAAFITLYRRGVTDHPRLNVHYRVEKRADGYAWSDLTQPQAAPPVIPTLETTMPLAEPPKAPTRTDFRTILEFLDQHYDLDNERWRGDLNDAKAADKLNMPRAWISAERERAFGPDVSERDTTKVAKEWASLIEEASGLSERALSLAAAVEAFKLKLEGLK